LGAVLTKENVRIEVVLHRRRILLYITPVIIIWAIFLSALQGVRIPHHLLIQPIECGMRHRIFDHNKTIMVQTANCNLEILRRELAVLDLCCGRANAGGIAGSHSLL
jgi:hypothetical protein